MNLNEYFDPINIGDLRQKHIDPKFQLIKEISVHTIDNPIKNIDDYDIAIIGVVDNDLDNINNSSQGLDKIRESLYSLSSLDKKPKIYDLGNVKIGKSVNDNAIGLRDVLVELITLQIMPVILGSSEKITYPNYLAYKKLDQKINFISIDSNISIVENSKKSYKSPLWRILVDDNESLFSYTNIGYQSHFVPGKIVKYLSENLHNYYRLGYIRSRIKEVEPIFRDADCIGLNISSIRQSEAFGQTNPSPNGYYGEEICQLARYAGMSSKLSSFGVFDYLHSIDLNNQTAHLIAQIVWYFINGFINRIPEYPLDSSENYKKFIVSLDTFEYELIFYKSEKTDRWWMEVPSFKSDQYKNLLISCTLDDYRNAGNGDVPERWLKAFQKIN
jgi:arginase family enzyme